MKHYLPQSLNSFFLLSLSLLLTACGGTPEETKAKAVSSLKEAAQSAKLEEDQLKLANTIVAFEKSGTIDPFWDNSYGCVIFPTIGKGGIGIGGAHGKGWVFSNDDLKGISSMSQLTIGFQWGGQAFSQIIFLEDEATYTHFTSGNFEFGAQASAVAITAGANASSSTAGGSVAGAGSAQSKADYSNGMATFTIAKGGLMYEASVGGQKFSYKDL